MALPMEAAMILFDGIYAAADGANSAYLAEEELPEFVTGKLAQYMGDNFWNVSWVPLVCDFTETVYANHANLSPNMKAVAAGVGATIAAYGFYDSLGGRAAGIVLALRRESGEEAEENFPWPEPSADPEPNADFIAPPPPGNGE